MLSIGLLLLLTPSFTEKKRDREAKSVVGCRRREALSLPPPGFASSFSFFRAREVLFPLWVVPSRG
jgi:hypothetical protein